jgi:membrane-bound metal-dependent hydrolase YbcI (DUF457 family)
MPVTPFHFGVGLAAKASAPTRVSFLAFVASQVVIDCESAYFLFTRGYPIHRVLHTFIVAVPVSILVGASVSIVWRWWCSTGHRAAWLPIAETAFWSCVLGGAIGGLTHPLLDGVMHEDIRPLWPFSDANPLLDAIGLGALHALCVACAIVGALVLAGRRASKG